MCFFLGLGWVEDDEREGSGGREGRGGKGKERNLGEWWREEKKRELLLGFVLEFYFPCCPGFGVEKGKSNGLDAVVHVATDTR